MTGFFQGVATALITPFTEDGVDFETLKALIERQKAGGADAVVLLGTTGEPAAMTLEEKKEVIRFSRSVVGGMKLIVGTGANCTETAKAMTKTAEELGADGVLVVTPYYNKCTQRGLVEYYRTISEATSLPVIVYNVPGRTGVNVLPAAMAEIAELPNIAGIKEASGNMAQVMETARLIRGKCDLYSGEDALNLPILCAGGAGVISVLANLIPEDVKALTSAVRRGDLKAANALSDRMLPLVKACFAEVNPIPVKAATGLLGYRAGLPRAPLTKIEPHDLALLREAMRGYGLEVKE